MRFTKYLAWAWMILVGGLLIVPGHVFCIACGVTDRGYIGDPAVLALGLVSVALGVLGIVGAAREKSGAAGQVART